MIKAVSLLALVPAFLGAGCGGGGNSPEKESGSRFEAGVRYLDLGTSRIAYYRRGAGRPMLMMTGTGSTMSEWDPSLLRLLARDHELILLDYPGSGSQPAGARIASPRSRM